jgi:hypothetical protein
MWMAVIPVSMSGKRVDYVGVSLLAIALVQLH